MNYSNLIEDKYIPQGITIIDGAYFLTAYSKSAPSRIYVYSKEKYLGKIILDNNAHVGGITYIKEHQIILITGKKGKVNAYDYNFLKKYLKKENFSLDLNDLAKDSYKIPCTINITPYGSAASIFYYAGYLYLNTFKGYTKGTLFKIKLHYSKENNIISKSSEKLVFYKIPKQIQGLSIINYNQKDYLILSKSIGKTISYIYAYEYQKNLKYLGKYPLSHSGSEGLVIEDDKITVIYEHYSHTSSTITIADLLKNLNKLPNIKNEIFSLITGVAYEYSKKYHKKNKTN